jgi:aminoglycoside phosphotransferase (APT) family kinase protein
MAARKMHADEFDTDVALVRRLIARQFRYWADLPIARVDSAGTVNALYRLGSDMVVRLPRVDEWAADVERELEWLPKLAPHLPLGVPLPLAKGSPDEAYPWTWAVYRWLPGETWAVDRIDDPRRGATDLAGFVAALQRIDAAGAPPSGRGGPLASRDSETRRAIEALQGVIDARATTAAWEESLRAQPWESPPVWTHGDLLPTNVLVADGRLSAVIDFGAVGAGDPACDLIAAWSLFAGEARDVFRAALQPDDVTWLRGRGWALSVALIALPYYRHTNPVFAALAANMIDEVLADHTSGRDRAPTNARRSSEEL